MTVVYWKRYPDDAVSSKSFDTDTEASRFWAQKQEDYRYVTGQVWSKRYLEAK